MLDNGINKILFPPSGGLSGEVPPVLPFLRLCFGLLVVVHVNDGEISDGLGSDRDGDRCVEDGGSHCLSYIHNEAPEDIGNDGRSRCLFVPVALISLLPHCNCLIGLNTDGSDKIGQLLIN